MILGSKRAQSPGDYANTQTYGRRSASDFVDRRKEEARKAYQKYVDDLDIITTDEFLAGVPDHNQQVRELSKSQTLENDLTRYRQSMALENGGRYKWEDESGRTYGIVMRPGSRIDDQIYVPNRRVYTGGRANELEYDIQTEFEPRVNYVRSEEALNEYRNASDNRSQYRSNAAQAPEVSAAAAASQNRSGHAGRDRYYQHMRQAELQDMMEPTTDAVTNTRNRAALDEARKASMPDYSEYLDYEPRELPMTEEELRNSKYWHGWDNESLDYQTALEDMLSDWEQEHGIDWETAREQNEVNHYLANYQKDMAEGNAEQYQLKADQMQTAANAPSSKWESPEFESWSWDADQGLFGNLSSLYENVQGNFETLRENVQGNLHNLEDRIIGSADPELREARQYNPDSLSDEERNIYRYIVGKYGLQAGTQYLNSIGDELNERAALAAGDAYKLLAEQNPAMGAVLDIATGPLAAVSNVGATITNMAGDEKINPYNPWLNVQRVQNSLQEGTQEGVWDNLTDDRGLVRGEDEEGGLFHVDPDSETARKVSDFAVGTGLSTANSLLYNSVLPAPVVDLMYGAGAAGETLLKAAEDPNVSKNQATMSALAAGAMEIIFEHFSIENFDSLKQTRPKDVREFFVNIGKSMLTEGSEEAATDLGNDIADLIINRENSVLAKEYKERLANGESVRDAIVNTGKDRFASAFVSLLGGAVSGAASGSAGGALGFALDRSASNRALKGADIQQTAENLRNDADNLHSDEAKEKAGEAADLADKLAEREKAGEKISASEYHELYILMDEAAASEQQALGNASSVGVSQEGTEENTNSEDEFSTGGQDVDADRAIGAMAKATTPEELVEIRDYGRHSLNPIVKDLIESAYTNYKGRMISNKRNLYKESDFEAAESLTVAEAFRMGRNGDKLPENATNAQKRAFLSGRGEALTTENQAELPDASNAEAVIRSTGAKAVITGIDHVRTKKTKDGYSKEVFVKTSDGETVNLNDIQAADPAMRHTFRNIIRLASEKAMNAYIENAPKGMPAGQYSNIFNKYYGQGSIGIKDFDDLYSSDATAAKQWFTDENKEKLRAIYNLGVSEHNDELMQAAADHGKTLVRKGSGRVKAPEGTSQGIIDYFTAVAEATGTDINLGTDVESNINGNFVRDAVQIVLNAKKGDKLFDTTFHELGEYVQAFNKNGMNEVRDAVLGFLVDNNGLDDFTDTGIKYMSGYTDVEGAKTFSDAMNEVVNDSLAGLFSTDEGVKEWTDWLEKNRPQSKKTILQKTADFFKQIADTIRKMINRANLSGPSLDTAIMAEDRAHELRQKFLHELDVAKKNAAETPVGDATESPVRNSIGVEELMNIRYSADLNTANNSDKERRYAELANKSINVVSVSKENLPTDIAGVDRLNRARATEAAPILNRIAERFGIYNKSYSLPEISSEVRFSKKSLSESVHKQNEIRAPRQYESFAIMLANFDDVINNAVPIETHLMTREEKGKRYDPTLKQVHVYLSAMQTEDGIIPVKLEAKEFKIEDKSKKNKLYVAITLPSTEKVGIKVSGSTKNGISEAPPTFEYNISDLLSDIKNNSASGSLGKYISDRFYNPGKGDALLQGSGEIETSAGEAKGLKELSQKEYDRDGNLQIAHDDSGSVVFNIPEGRHSLETLANTKRKLRQVMEERGYDPSDISRALESLDMQAEMLQEIAKVYPEMEEALHADIITDVTGGKQVLRSFIKNGEYPVNVDFMTICKKRQAYMRVLTDLIDDGTFARVAFKPEAIAAVNNILRDNEYETACLGCFVESRRLQIQKWAESFCDAWNKQVKEAAGRNATPFRFGKEAKGGNSLSADEILRLQDEYSKAGKKNSKGNLNLGQGTVESKMARLLERIPSLAHTLEPGDIIKTNGIANLRRHYGDIYSLLLQWYGSNTPKVNQDFNPYNGEFSDLNYAFMKTATGETLGGGKQYKNWAKNQIRNEKGPNYKATRSEIEDLAIQKYLYDIGGARLQSFSDFLIENTLDYFQMVGDLAAKKLPMHAYSKEISFIRIFGMTGLKANMSLIPVINRAAGRDMAGLNPDGSYAGWGDYEHHIMMRGQSFIQSIGFKDALALQLDPRYSKNIGTIAIGVSDKHIMKMLDDSKIRMIIPYHRSGMSPAFAKLMDIDAYTDYTDDQNTTVKQYYDLDGNPVQGFDGKIKCDTVYNYNEAAQRLGDARKAADEYKQWCAERHPVYRDGKKIGEATFRPKFEKFSTHDNYYKLLEDFNMYDAITEESAPQTAVEMRYPDANNKLTAKELSDYKERLRETGEFSEEEIEKYAKKAQMSLEEIIRKEATDRNKYHRDADAKYDSTLKEIEGMLKDKYPRDDFDISGLEVRNAVDLDDFWFGEDSDANLASVEDEYYRPAASIMEEGAKALAEEQVDTAAIRRIATEIKREYGSNYSTNDLIDNLEKVFAYAQSNNDSISYDNLMSVLAEVAQPVIDESTQKVGDEEYKSFMDAMKGYKIALTERQKDEVISAFGSYQEYRRAMRGINISNNGTTLDRIWIELNELVPGMLDEDTSEGDMPLALYDAMTALEPTVKNSYGADSKEVARNLALEIVEKYFEQAGARAGNEKAREAARRASQKAKEAGKQYKEQLRKRYNERIAKAREDLGKRYSQMTREQRERFQEKARKLRETHKQDIAEIRARNRQQAINRRAMQDANYEKQMIDRRARKMATWLRSPSDTKHVPKALQRTVESLVGAIDLVTPHVVRNPEGSWTVQVIERYDPEGFSVTRPETFSSRAAAVQAYRDSYRQSKQDPNYRRWTERMSDLRDMYNRAARGEEEDANGTIGDFLHMLDTSLTESFSDLIKRGAAVEDVSDLGADDLRTLNRVLANVEHAVNQINKAYSSNAEISALAQDTIQNSKKYKGRGNHSRVVNSTIDFLTIHNATPETFFHTLGKGGEQIYKMLRKGLNQRARDIRRANEYTLGENGILKGIDISKWSGRKVKPTEYKLQSGESVYMTPAQVMSLYELSKRQQAMFHQTGGFSVEKQLINGKEVRQRYKHFTDADVKRITDTLSDEQKRVADDLQKFLARDCAEWGNETSNKLYGYDKFGDPNYFPISTDKEVVATQNKDVATNSINAIKNMGFTKEVKPNAQNPIVIRDIFDVFTGHVTDMAAYHSYAAPITDLLRWYNYTEKDVDKKTGFADYTTTKGAIADLTGSRGGNYVTTLLSGLNNMERSNYFGGPTELLMGHFKAAAIAGNMRVVIQQPTAYFRAGNVISYKWLTEALAASKKTKDDAKRMQDETSDISWWKSQGYWETGIGKSLKNIITGDQTAAEKFTEATMAPAGKADDITWGVLYRAVYMEQKDRFLKDGKATDTDEFRDAVNDRFDEVIDRTQVVDSTLHRSQFMRATDPLSKTQTAFMAEPTKNLNMFIRAHADAVKSYQDNGGKISRDTYRNLVRAGAAVTITAVVNAAAQSIIDALRHHSDDKDYIEQWLEEWRANFINNMNPLDWIPILKDLGGFGDIIKAAVTGENYNMFSGSDSSRMDMAALNQAAQAIYRTAQYSRGKGSYTLYGVVKQNVRALSQLAGMPFYNLMRDAEALYNTLNDRSGLPDLISKTSGSKNAKLFEAIDSGKAVEDTIAKEVDGGRTIKDIQSAISSHYKSDYYDYYEAEDDRYEDIGDKAAEAFKATGMTDEEVATLLEEWRNPSLSYNLLDGAIDGSGDDIGQMISDLRDADKTPESIKGHLVSRYASTLRYNEGRGLIDEELNANLAQAFTALGVSDPEDMVRQIASGEITEDTSFKYTDDFARAINTGGDIAGEAQKLRDAGKENDTIKSAITSLYKDQYAELLNSDPQEAADLKDRLVQAFVAAGDTEEKASKKIDNWITGPQLEAARENFTNAIESGGNLSAGVNALHDLGQDDGAIRNFITSEYKQKYTDLYEQNQTEASKLKKQLVNAFMAAGDSREDAEGKIDNWITGPKVAEAKGNMFTAINDGGNITGQVDELRKLGKDDSTIKSYITSEYKPQYIELYNTNRSAALELQNKLIRAYMAAGDTHEQALKKINKWVE